MARTPLAVVNAPRAGAPVAFTQADLVNGNAMPNQGGNTLLIVRNAGAAPATVTMRVPKTIDVDLTVADRVLPIPANTTLLFANFQADVYNQADGTVSVDCSAALGLLAIQA